MTRKINKRISDLEKKVQPKDETKIVIVWDRDPPPPKPGEVVITWDDIEGEQENDKED